MSRECDYLNFCYHIFVLTLSGIICSRFFPPSMETTSAQEKAIQKQKAEAEATASQLSDAPEADLANSDRL